MSESSMNGGKIAILMLFLAAIAGTVYVIYGRSDRPESNAASASVGSPAATVPSSNLPPKVTTTLRFLYSTEKKAWLTEALGRFGREHPEIKLETAEKGSFDMVQALLDQGERPTLISPADDVQLNLLVSDYRQKTGQPLIDTEGPDKPLPLVLTPLVLVAWEDRASLLTARDRTLTFHDLLKAIEQPRGWLGVKGKAEWGFVKFGHTSPARSNSGLQTLVLLAYEYHKKRGGLEVADVMDPGFQKFVKGLEKGVSKFGTSTGEFMEEMVLYGPSKYDVVVSYENLAIQHLGNAVGRWGNLRVYYPAQTMWSSHPVAVLKGDWVSPEQRLAARMLIDYLRDRPEQTRALELGFRPSNPNVAVVADDKSPFKNAERFGVKVELGSVVEAPPGPVVRNLIEMWSRLIAR